MSNSDTAMFDRLTKFEVLLLGMVHSRGGVRRVSELTYLTNLGPALCSMARLEEVGMVVFDGQAIRITNLGFEALVYRVNS